MYLRNTLWSSLNVTPSCFSRHQQQGGGPVWNKGLGSRTDCRQPLEGGFSSLLRWACASDSPGIPASRQNRQDEQPRGEAPSLLPLGSSPHTPALGKASCPVATLLSTRAPSALPFHAHVACARPQAELTLHRFTSRGPGKCLYFGMSQKYIFVQSGKEQSVFFLWKGWGHGEGAWAGLGGGPGVQEQ